MIPRTTELDGDKDPYKEESYARYNLKDYAPALMLDEALSFIRTAKDKPFLPSFYYNHTSCTASGSKGMG